MGLGDEELWTVLSLSRILSLSLIWWQYSTRFPSLLHSTLRFSILLGLHHPGGAPKSFITSFLKVTVSSLALLPYLHDIALLLESVYFCIG
jgi:hypothetical protein